jgi:hydrogenase maturation protein HypF
VAEALRIRVRGVVQGVGFRPFVWRLAQACALCGWVRNDAAGVEIHAEGSPAALAEFVRRLRREAPPLARVDAVDTRPASPAGCRDFTIVASERRGPTQTAIGFDTAPCADCLAELFDPANRRYRHPFITCTHCGPRYTLTRRLPYDRDTTSMARFPLCADCAREYHDPADRRFHAETICCPQCGPRLNGCSMRTGSQSTAIRSPPRWRYCARARSSRSRAWAASISPATLMTPPQSTRCARANNARRSPSR